MDRKICHNGKDPISLKYIDDIDPKYLVTLRCGDHEFCHDIRSLLPRLSRGNNIDPICRLEINSATIEKIFEQADELGLLESTEDKDEDFVPRHSELIDRTFRQRILGNPYENIRLQPEDPDESHRMIKKIKENMRPLPREFYPYN